MLEELIVYKFLKLNLSLNINFLEDVILITKNYLESTANLAMVSLDDIGEMTMINILLLILVLSLEHLMKSLNMKEYLLLFLNNSQSNLLLALIDGEELPIQQVKALSLH